jgi:hypothetical protein
MNTKTKELFAQALDTAVPETWTALTPEQLTKVMEKFGELLVRECADIAADMSALDIYEEIREHFGVTQ